MGAFLIATFRVNGQTIQIAEDRNLLDFLRDELRLTSVRDGCSEGACGACMVLVAAETAVAGAYFRRDGVFRTQLPLLGTPYSRKR